MSAETQAAEFVPVPNLERVMYQGGLATRKLTIVSPPDISGVLDAAESMTGILDPTPLEPLEFASVASGNEVMVKREDLSLVGSFKGRGAWNRMRKIPDNLRGLGARLTSSGNHSQGGAMAAWLLDIDLVAYMPLTAPHEKVRATEKWGATVVQAGDNYSEAAQYANELHRGDPRPDIHPYDHEDVIDGQATAALEILAEYPDLTHIFIPGGGGGYSAGVGKTIKHERPEVQVIVVEPEGSNAIQLGYIAGEPVPLPQPPTLFADGVAVRQVGNVTLPHILRNVDGVITVSKDEMITALTSFFNEKKKMLEPAGILAIAGALKYAQITGCEGQKFVTLASGSTISAGKAGEILKRGEELTGHEALFSVKISEEPGSLRRFGKEVVGKRNITELMYSRDDPELATIQIGFSVNGGGDRGQFVERLTEDGYDYIDRTADADFKDYERSVLNRGKEAVDGIAYVIDLPERAGALVDLLDTLGDNWDISEIIYATHRSETGSPRITFSSSNRQQLEGCLEQAGYSYRAVQPSKR